MVHAVRFRSIPIRQNVFAESGMQMSNNTRKLIELNLKRRYEQQSLRPACVSAQLDHCLSFCSCVDLSGQIEKAPINSIKLSLHYSQIFQEPISDNWAQFSSKRFLRH